MYSVQHYEAPMLKATGERVVDLSSTGDKALWGPNFVTHIVIAMAVALNATPGDAGVLKFDLRPTTGSDTSRTDGTVGIINLATTHTFTAGSVQPVVFYRPTTPIVVKPGQEVVAEMTDASASVTAASITLWVEPVYSTPGVDNTAMIVTT